MRLTSILPVLIVIALAGCGDDAGGPSTNPQCPADLEIGTFCSPAMGRCWHYDDFSSCSSGWCGCVGGLVVCDELNPVDGESCADAPITSCYAEGVPACADPPTSRRCDCDIDGTWHCICACYGGFSNTCDNDCPDRYIPEIEGIECAFPGTDCTYPDHICHCRDDGFGTIRLVCDAT